jgi:hypothetical protein
LTKVTGIELDGVLYDLADGGILTERTTDPDPDPEPEVIPDAVRASGATHPLAAVNPVRGPDRDYPGGRGPDELVAYLPGGSQAEANQYGVVAVVADGRVVEVTAWQAGSWSTPQDGLILSGHGQAAAWLTAHARRDVAVELIRQDDDPTPTPVTHGRMVAVYLKMWPNGKLPGLAAAAKSGITDVRLAFMQGSPLALVGWGSQTQDQVIEDCRTLRSRGVAVTASIGGKGGHVDTSSPTAVVDRVASLHATIGLDQIDWDVEASALRSSDVVEISQRLCDGYGIAPTMAPNGSNVGTYLPVAVELHKRGILTAYGQQFYEAPVSLDAAKGRIDEAITAGLPPEVIQVGMMIGSGSKYWSLDTCAANMAAIKDEWPEIGGAYLWSETHSEVADWAAWMGAVLGTA